MSAFDKLSTPVQQYIYEKCFTQETAIQEAAIPKIMDTDMNYVLVSGTAEGKTEAVLLPAVSLADFETPGVKMLYLSPLVALINDQMERFEELCEHLGVRVTKWHGEAKQSRKNALLKDPNGVVLMTPESLEGMFQCHPELLPELFGNLQFVVVDEIHYFIGTDRGQHIRSLLHRLGQVCEKPFRWFGLSATLGGDYQAVKEFLGNSDNTKVLLDASSRPTNVEFNYFPAEERGKIPEEAINCISTLIEGKRAMVYPNSRNVVEELAVKMKALGHLNVYSHHSSVSKDERESAEEFAREVGEQDMAIFCTSTCELGIDFGKIVLIVQYNAVPSVSSLVQRAGRSGRRSGVANIAFVNTDPWCLLQNLACWNLYKNGTIEAPDTKVLWYKTVVHQLLSIVKEKKEINREDLTAQILANPAFSYCRQDEVESIIEKLIADSILEDLDGSLVIGTEGERYVGKRDSYIAFDAPRNYRVLADNHLVGEFEPNVELKTGACLYLSARAWEITGIDRGKYIVHVKESAGGKKPRYTSQGVIVCPEVEREMCRILTSSEQSEYLTPEVNQVIGELQAELKKCSIIGNGVPYYVSSVNQFCFAPFAGTKVFNALALMFNALSDGYFLSINLSRNEFVDKCRQLINETPDIVAIIRERIEKGEIEITSRLGKLLPVELQAKMEASQKYDVEGAISLLKSFVRDSNEEIN